MSIGLIVLTAAAVVIAFYLGKRSAPSNDTNIQFDIDTDTYSDYDEVENGGEYDSWEGGFWGASNPKKLTAHLQFDYTDGNGNSSTRSVKVREFDDDLYKEIIMGYCELRLERFDLIGLKTALILEQGRW